MATPTVTKIPSVSVALPAEMHQVFTKTVIENVVGIACTPPTGQTVDFSDEAFKSSTSVVRASFMSHCTMEEAGLELAQRLEAAEDDLAVRKIQGSIDLLKAGAANRPDACTQVGQGLYTFIWAKVGQCTEMLKAGKVKIASLASKASTSDLTATIRYPESEADFMFMLNDWALVVSSLGLLSFALVMRFIKDTVQYTMMNLKQSYQVTCCLFLVYLKRVENDPTRTLTLATVYRAGSCDTYLAEAKQMAAAFFRTRVGNTPEPEVKPGDDKPKWNGKSTPTAKKPCAAFNFATPHRHSALDASGCCKFAHKCNQWVDDKGPGGMCFGDHKKSECDYDPAHKRDKALP